ncbi:MAG: cupin 2 domain-containing protein [Halieaceae bacterium]|jgi:cupin 2 domain-containing protein
MTNIFADIPENLPEELLSCLMQREGLRLERIVSRGQSSPAEGWYDQDGPEWVLVLRGEAVIAYPDKPSVALGEGDYLNIAAHEQHRVDWTAPDETTVWLALYY